MSILTITGTAGLTMTSLEIAELVGKRHDNVKRTVETLAEQGVISLPQIEEVKIPRERRDETVGAYRFENEKGKRDSIVVVAQLSPEFTARLVDRWQELEAKLAKPAPAELSHLEILQLAIDSGQKLIAAEAERDKAIRDAVVTVERVLHGLLGKASPGKVLQVSHRNSESPGAKRTRAYRERKKAAAEIDKQQIGSKREAAAMAKASAATLEVQRLKGELGRHAEHATVIAVERATGKKWPKNTYVALRRWCKCNNAMPVDVLDERYGTVKSWPAGAWLEAYGICLDKLFPVAPL